MRQALGLSKIGRIFGMLLWHGLQNYVLYSNKKQPLGNLNILQNFYKYSHNFNASFFEVFPKFFDDKFGDSDFFSTFVHPMLCF
jgi:hypothetical protein